MFHFYARATEVRLSSSGSDGPQVVSRGSGGFPVIHSMTGFARAETQTDGGQLSWEIRTVNHRYLELGIKLPEDFKAKLKLMTLTLELKRLKTNFLNFPKLNENL